MGKVSLEVVGNPATGPWGVEGSTSDPRNVMATVRFDGVVHHVEHDAPYGFPGDNGTTAKTGLFGKGSHTVEFRSEERRVGNESGWGGLTGREGRWDTPAGGEETQGA